MSLPSYGYSIRNIINRLFLRYIFCQESVLRLCVSNAVDTLNLVDRLKNFESSKNENLFWTPFHSKNETKQIYWELLSTELIDQIIDSSGPKRNEMAVKILPPFSTKTKDFPCWTVEIFWDDPLRRLQWCRFLGLRSHVERLDFQVDSIYSMTLLENWIFGTDPTSGSIVKFGRLERDRQKKPEIVKQRLNYTASIYMYHRQRQPGRNWENNLEKHWKLFWGNMSLGRVFV